MKIWRNLHYKSGYNVTHMTKSCQNLTNLMSLGLQTHRSGSATYRIKEEYVYSLMFSFQLVNQIDLIFTRMCSAIMMLEHKVFQFWHKAVAVATCCLQRKQHYFQFYLSLI